MANIVGVRAYYVCSGAIIALARLAKGEVHNSVFCALRVSVHEQNAQFPNES